ncbi:hypothetical protein IAG44_07960 [Streptomyces roseirectus]|uniref:Uncharacterized protein n=1 Tax=Streptomyces roseirectus TaxID=2768066 RepID=A0A7H0I9B1_9ACTN|nr:DUF6304 family protein [Streptomyces roseirectus]QNP69377.1 hypothetical protein IAG44_07960 [Streptomyces roseirectus]
MRYWPGHYTDRHGREPVVFTSDGRARIRVTIRGVLFEGDSMDDLGALSGEPPARAFTFMDDGALCSCLLEWQEPLPVTVEGDGTRTGALHCALRMGDPRPAGGGIDAQALSVFLRLDGRDYPAEGVHHGIEDALHEIQLRLPAGTRVKACVACAWSDYSPAGSGLMGDLACFRDAKEAYRRVRGKHGPDGIFACWDRLTEFVQETWLCGEFEERTGSPGYRGAFPYTR